MRASVHQQINQLITERKLELVGLNEILATSYSAQSILLYYQICFANKIEHGLRDHYAGVRSILKIMYMLPFYLKIDA
jgi:hypothetical protein